MGHHVWAFPRPIPAVAERFGTEWQPIEEMIVMASQADFERTRQGLQAALRKVVPPEGYAKADAEFSCDFLLGTSDYFLEQFNQTLAAGDEKLALQYLAISNWYFHEYVNCDPSVTGI